MKRNDIGSACRAGPHGAPCGAGPCRRRHGPGPGGDRRDDPGLSAEEPRGHRGSHRGSCGRSGGRRSAGAPRPPYGRMARRSARTRCRPSPAIRKVTSPWSSSSTTSCGYCKRALPAVTALLKEGRECARRLEGVPDPGSRLGHSPPARPWRPTGRANTTPSTLALMKEPELTEQKVLEIAGETGIDMERLGRDMKDPAIRAYLDETPRDLAQEIGIYRHARLRDRRHAGSGRHGCRTHEGACRGRARRRRTGVTAGSSMKIRDAQTRDPRSSSFRPDGWTEPARPSSKPNFTMSPGVPAVAR